MRTIARISRIIGPIFAVDRGASLQPFAGWKNLASKKLETSGYRMVQSVFRYLEPVYAWLTSATDGEGAESAGPENTG